jgi:hypothetical protein
VNLAIVEFRCAHWLAKLDVREIFNETERERERERVGLFYAP